MTLREGLARSKNTITAQLMMRVGPSTVARLARAMGVRDSNLEEVPSLALGTSPVTLKEMVAAFGTIANGGSYIEPQIVTAVEDRSGQVLAAFSPGMPEPALSHDAAATLLDVLRGVVDGGTAAGLKPRFGLAGDLAGKTGTTQDNTDGWFILMHPRLVAGAWMGFNDNRVRMRSEYWGQGSHNALFVVGDFMQQSTKAGLVDAKATFAAPRMKDREQPLMDRMGDWWNSVFNTPPSAPPPETEVAVVPPVELPTVNLEPPVLEPPPTALPPVPRETYRVVPNAPVIVDAQPQRVPSFPRPLEAAKPADTIPGTQVYRLPETTARVPDLPVPGSSTTVRIAPQGTGPAAPPPSSDAITRHGEATPRARSEQTYTAAPAQRSESSTATLVQARRGTLHRSKAAAARPRGEAVAPRRRAMPRPWGAEAPMKGAAPLPARTPAAPNPWARPAAASRHRWSRARKRAGSSRPSCRALGFRCDRASCAPRAGGCRCAPLPPRRRVPSEACPWLRARGRAPSGWCRP